MPRDKVKAKINRDRWRSLNPERHAEHQREWRLKHIDDINAKARAKRLAAGCEPRVPGKRPYVHKKRIPKPKPDKYSRTPFAKYRQVFNNGESVKCRAIAMHDIAVETGHCMLTAEYKVRLLSKFPEILIPIDDV